MEQSWIKNRWKKAKLQQSLYNRQNNENVGASEFFKNENILTKKLRKYIVTIKLDNSATDYEFFIPQESYVVYGFQDMENKEHIVESTKQSVASLFKGNSVGWIYDNVDVEIRGVEIDKINYDDVKPDRLEYSRAYTDDNPKLEVNKNKYGSKSNKTPLTLNIWLK